MQRCRNTSVAFLGVIVPMIAGIVPCLGFFADQASPPDQTAELRPGETGLPQLRLAAIPDYEDDDAFVASFAARARELVHRSEQAPNARTRVDLLLAAANLILARELEPACSRKLLRLRHEAKPPDPTRLTRSIDHASELLDRAGKAMDAAVGEKESSDSPAADWTDETRRLTALNAFAAGLRAYLLPGDGPEASRRARRSASQLSVLLDDENPRIVAAATLWHACLRGGEADVGPALSVLDHALSEPQRHSMPYALFARLLRCRLVAKRGSAVTALALLVQMEDLRDEWLTDDAHRGDALRAITLTQAQILSDWHDAMPPSANGPERLWCAKRVAALRAERFNDETSVFRLGIAIPIIAPEPESAQSTTSTPAARP
ncbi:MAG: hypothetical protein IIB60_01120 [Planctomycetes bacterium]|nr:hypothetical protein [Planctomycetota bacterium]